MALYSWLSVFMTSPENASYQELRNIQNQLQNLEVPSNSVQKILPPSHGMYFGAFANFEQTEDVVTAEKIRRFSTLVDKKLAWAYFSDNWFTGIKFPSETVELLDDLGITPYIRMMPRTDFRIQPGDSPYTLQRIRDGEYDEELRAWARDAKRADVPLLLEFGTEVNGKWFPWNGKWNGDVSINLNGESENTGTTLFIETYRHIIDLFEAEQVENVTWVYHVNAISSPNENWNDLDKYYPGDDYIDWIGVSVYGAQSINDTWVDFDTIYSRAYKKITSFTEKPIAIVELGVAEGSSESLKVAWITNALQSLEQGKYPRTKAVSYWHSSWYDTGVEYSLRIDSSTSAEQAFRDGINSSYFISNTLIK